jgi:predicted 3-demethylubiquinone-9 3-methyltransferase (glyoxalase superfamily)
MQKIVPNLWFDTQAEEAAKFYISIFGGEITEVTRYPEGGPGAEGDVLTVTWRMFGQDFTGINGGPQFEFTEAISLLVNCADQAEVDEMWDKLLAGGGEPSQCGWLKDKFGLSWQVVPEGFLEMFRDGEPARINNAMKAMFGMVKLDLEELKRAYEEPVTV